MSPQKIEEKEDSEILRHRKHGLLEPTQSLFIVKVNQKGWVLHLQVITWTFEVVIWQDKEMSRRMYLFIS